MKGLPCLSCNHIIHRKCSDLSCKDLKETLSNIKYWECKICQNNKFPFSNVDDDELTKSCFNSNYNCQCGIKKVNYTSNNDYKLLLNISTHKDNWENHDPEIDGFFNQFVDLKPNFKYYDVHDFHQIKNKLNYGRCFSVIHLNICSLQANADGLESFLCDLEFKFDVVSLSETWNPENKKQNFKPPKIDGYHEYFGTN